jgi:hemolysin activation/secretion protein
LPLSAQVPPQPTREQVQPPRPRDEGRPPPQLTTEGGVGQSPCPLADPAYANLEFTLQGVRFDNLRGLPPEALEPAWRPYAGKSQKLAAICAIRDKAAAILTDSGYIAAIEIPEQRIADGIVRFDVLMAKLVSVRVRGDAGRSERIIARTLDPLTRREVFNVGEAERALLLAGDLPGFDVRLALKSAGGARGEVVGEVTVRRLPAQIDANVQNYGSRSLGRFGGLVRAELFGLTGLGDRTSFTAFTTIDFDEQQTVQAAHEFRIGGDGLTLGGDLTLSWARPDIGLAGINLRARTLLATALLKYPFVRSRRLSVWGGLGFEAVDQKVSFNGLPLNRDEMRVALARLEVEAAHGPSFVRAGGYSPAEPRWRLSATLELRRGLDGLGASEDCGPALVRCIAPGAVALSRLEGDPSATVLRGEALAEFRPSPDIAVALGARGQYAGTPLLAFEEYSAGNYTVGRGYDPGTLLGDKGIGFQAEFRFGSIVPRTAKSVAWQPYLFADAAWVSNEDRLFPFAGRRRLASVGGGVRAAFGDSARVDAVIAVPLVRAGLQTEKADPRLLVSFTTSIRPWSFR